MIKIPVFQSISADFVQEIELNGQIVNIRIVYNIRNSFFHLRFTDSEGTEITGIKIVPNYPLLEAHKAFLDFSGELFVIKVDESAEDIITYDNFGRGYAFYYYTNAEYDAWKVANGLE